MKKIMSLEQKRNHKYKKPDSRKKKYLYWDNFQKLNINISLLQD